MAVQIEPHGRVRVVRFDRPERLNAFDADQLGWVADALLAAEADDAVGVVVLTGTGRAFSAGADLQALATGGRRTGSEFERMMDAVATVTKPVVAAVNGLAVGIGTTILLHCDLVLADPSARFRTPFATLGTAPEAASSLLLAQRTNAQFANVMLLTGEWVDADSAVRNHLVARLSAPGEVLAEAIALAEQLAAHAPAALSSAKRLMAHGQADPIKAARERETQEAARLGADGLLTFLK